MIVMFVMTVMIRCPGGRSMRCTGRGMSGRDTIELGSRVQGSSSDSVRSQVERLYPRLVGQDEPQHAGKVGGACQVQRRVERIVADAEIGPVILKDLEAVVGKGAVPVNRAHADGHVDGVAAIALLVVGRPSLK